MRKIYYYFNKLQKFFNIISWPKLFLNKIKRVKFIKITISYSLIFLIVAYNYKPLIAYSNHSYTNTEFTSSFLIWVNDIFSLKQKRYGNNSLVSSSDYISPITKDGMKLLDFINSFDVANHWLPSQYIDWLTGKPIPYHKGAYTSHCSAFVAAITTRLNIYIPNPSVFSAVLLANRQNKWLLKEGAKNGWIQLHSFVDAQNFANQGYLVLAGHLNANPKRPGHIAVVRPANKSLSLIEKEGPQIAQAGIRNYNSASLKMGFKRSFYNNSITFFAHKITW